MNDLTRREALAGVAGAGALALAGCVSSDDTEAADNPSDDADAESTDEPTLSASVERTGSDCSNPEPGRARVFFDEEFAVSGSIPAPDSCHVPELTAHSLADGTLSLTVDVTPDSGESCPDCTGIVHYEATVSGPTLDDVDRMSVSHADGETYETPASEIRAGPPAVQGATLTETTGRTRGSGDQSRADIMPPESNGDTGTVTIEGAIPTNHPHHEAVLEEATIRGDTLRVAVGVQSTLDDDRAGTMPLGIVEYTAEVTVEYPDGLRSVTLAHPNSGYGSSWASDSASASAEQ